MPTSSISRKNQAMNGDMHKRSNVAKPITGISLKSNLIFESCNPITKINKGMAAILIRCRLLDKASGISTKNDVNNKEIIIIINIGILTISTKKPFRVDLSLKTYIAKGFYYRVIPGQGTIVGIIAASP